MARMQWSICTDSPSFPRAEELDYELDLPPYTHSTILLDLDYYAAKTYNMMQTAIAVNAVDSERTGPVRITTISPCTSPSNSILTAFVSRITCLVLRWGFDFSGRGIAEHDWFVHVNIE